jgi:hypothetical protein
MTTSKAKEAWWRKLEEIEQRRSAAASLHWRTGTAETKRAWEETQREWDDHYADRYGNPPPNQLHREPHNER